MHHMSLYLVILLDSRWRYSQLVCHFLGKENCIRSHYDRLNSNFNSVPDISACFSCSMASKVWGPHYSRYKSPQQLYNQLPHILPYVREIKQACTRPVRVFITEGLFTWREGAPANRATRLEGLAHCPPLHATHLTGTMSGLRELSLERLLSTTNIITADQGNFFPSYFSFLREHEPVLCLFGR